MTSKSYKADSIEVLEGLDPVRKRPGMYTDTTRPNHLVQEVVDNSVDEALEGHATEIRVTLRKDGCIKKRSYRGLNSSLQSFIQAPNLTRITISFQAVCMGLVFPLLMRFLHSLKFISKEMVSYIICLLKMGISLKV